MIKLAFKICSVFWLLSPIGFGVGWIMGVWNFKYDLFLFLFLMLMMGVSAFLNFGEER